MKASKTLNLPPVVRALMDKWDAEKKTELRKKLTEQVAEYKRYSTPAPPPAIAEVSLVEEVTPKLEVGDIVWCEELQVYGEIDRIYLDNGVETAAFSWQDGCKCAVAPIDSLSPASGPPTFDPEWIPPEADFEPLPSTPPEINDEWLTKLNLNDVVQTLESCDEEGLGELRKIWPKIALSEACKFLPEAKKEQIKQWVVAQNETSTNTRHLWNKEVLRGRLPNGKIAVAKTINLQTVVQALFECDGSEGLKILREKYHSDILNFAWASLGNIEIQQLVKGWMVDSVPEVSPPPCTLIRTEFGDRWFELSFIPKSEQPEADSPDPPLNEIPAPEIEQTPAIATPEPDPPSAIATPESDPPPVIAAKGNSTKYHLITDGKSLAEALVPLQSAKHIGLDTETTGLDPHLHKVRLVQIAAPGHVTLVIDLTVMVSADLKPLSQLLQGPSIKISHNLKFDWQFLTKAGLKPAGPFFDTMLASQLLTAGLTGTHSLQAIAKTYLGIDLNKEQRLSDWAGELKPEQLEYAATDAAVLLELREVLRSTLLDSNLAQAAKLEFDAIPAVADIELNGMLLDLSKWETLGREMNQSKAKAKAELGQQLRSGNPQISLFAEYDGVDPDSPQQVLSALQALGVPVKSTGKNALIPLAEKYPLIKTLLEYRGFAKMVSAFTDKLPTHISPVTGRIHANYNQYGAATGRFSVNNPNLQQIPRSKEVRSCFIPAPGYKLVIADYSQIELRVAAEISCDRTMVEAYQKGEDLHRLTASLITGKPLHEISKAERQAGKPVNFGLIYGCGAKKLGQTAENDYGVVKSLEEWEAYRTKFFEAYRGIASWHSQLIRERPMEVRTLSGRRRQWAEQPWVTATSNSIVQGTAADITKKALVLLPAALEGTGARLIGTVHDEFLLEVPEAAAKEAAKILKETMEAAGKEYLKLVPVEAEVNVVDSWADK